MPILSLDAGTTSSRALVFADDGAILAVAQREFTQFYPQPGWVEHDAEEIWRTQIDVAQEAVRNANVAIDAIGITNQRETTVLWDRETGKPVANAIVWQDRRTAELCDALREHETLVQSRTGLVIDAYFSGTKLRWLLDEVSGRRTAGGGQWGTDESRRPPSAVRRPPINPSRLAFGTIDSWLIWNLTRGDAHVTDVTNASRTMLFDIHRGVWDDELLALLGIPRSVLPEVRSSSAIVAKTASGLPIPAGIPIAGIAGDQQAALFGQRCTRAGMAKNTYGTGSFVVMNTGDTVVKSSHGLLATIAWRLGDGPLQYAIEGSIFVTGAAVQWLRDELRIIKSAAEVEELAGSVPDSGGVMLVPAFTGLGTPHWDPYARGTILGLTRGSSAAHIARATLDSIAWQTADVLEAMRDDSGIALTELRVDGGASTNDLLMQIQADAAGIPVVRTRNPETTALGAAYLAGLPTPDAQTQPERVFEPRITSAQREEKLALWRRAVERSKHWAMAVLLLFIAAKTAALPPPLHIDSITPNIGRPLGGELVQIRGGGFDPPARVFFGEREAFIIQMTPGRIDVLTPPVTLSGPDQQLEVDVRVTVPKDYSAIVQRGFTYRQEHLTPRIVSILPNRGSVDGGLRIAILGEGFQAPVQVLFNDVEVRIIDVDFNEIVAETPSAAQLGVGIDEPIDVRVRNIASQTEDVKRGGFRFVAAPVISGISPTSGPSTGGTNVLIAGSHFNAPVAVSIAGVTASPLRITGNEILARTNDAGITDCRDRTGPVHVIDLMTGNLATGPNFTYVHAPLHIVDVVQRAVTPGNGLQIVLANPTGRVLVAFGNVVVEPPLVSGSVAFLTVPNVDFPTRACSFQGVAGVERLPLTVDVRVSDAAGCTDIARGALTIRPIDETVCRLPPAVTVIHPPEGECLRFGRVFGPATATIELANRDLPGTTPLELSSAFITGPDAADFDILGSPASPRLTVTYRGTTRGYRRATAVIRTNDPARPVVEICLRAFRL